MIHRRLSALLCVLCLSMTVRAQGSVDAANAVIQREMPHLAGQIHLTLKAGDYEGKADGFRISGKRGDIHVEAATVPTLLFGVNWYLKYVGAFECVHGWKSVGWSGDDAACSTGPDGEACAISVSLCTE